MFISSSNPVVSIVIPCYNYGRFLREAVNSAIRQTYSSIEIIVMDDGSTDDTPEVAASFGTRIRYFRNPNQGVYTTRQASLNIVRGQYFLNLDADNKLHTEFVARSLNRLINIKDDRCAFVYTQRKYFGEAEGCSQFPSYDPALLKIRNYIDMGSLLRTDIVRRFGFDPAFNNGCGDYDFFLTLAENGYYGVLLDEPLLFYRVHTSSITHSVSTSYRQVEIIKRLLNKHKDMYTPTERRQAFKTARQRVLLAIIKNRQPSRAFNQRLKDLVRILGTPAGPAQLWEQAKYTISPSLKRNSQSLEPHKLL